MTRGKNILILISDEHQASALSCRNHPHIKTPNLDRLAERGVLFENAYTPSPICVPARAALATGKYLNQMGYWDNAMAYDGRVPGWGHELEQAGVEAVSIGKLHYRNETDPTGFAEQIIPLHIQGGVGQIWGSVRNPLPEKPRTSNIFAQLGPGYSKYNKYDEMVCQNTVDWLHAKAGSPEPWLLFSSFVAPHFPLVVPQAYFDLYDPDEIGLPPQRERSGYALHPWLARKHAFYPHDAHFADDDTRRLAIASYYGLCTFMDEQIGKVLDALEQSGQLDDTLIIYTSDHGESLGQRNNWGKSVLYGEATRVPLIMSGHGLPQGTTCATPANLVDIAPTITDFFGIGPGADWPGTSLLELASAPDNPHRISFSEYHAAESPTGAFMVANARWKYHYYVGYPPELFDLDTDPMERDNLAGTPDYAAIEAKMHTALLAVCDPEMTDAAAKADQDTLVAKWGGPEKASQAGPQGASPVPV